MLRRIAVDRLVSEGFTREEAEYYISNIIVDLKRVYSIRVYHKRHTVKVEATHLSPEDLFKEAFLYMTTIYMIDHKEDYEQNPAKAARSLREKVDQLQIEACKEAYLKE